MAKPDMPVGAHRENRSPSCSIVATTQSEPSDPNETGGERHLSAVVLGDDRFGHLLGAPDRSRAGRPPIPDPTHRASERLNESAPRDSSPPLEDLVSQPQSLEDFDGLGVQDGGPVPTEWCVVRVNRQSTSRRANSAATSNPVGPAPTTTGGLRSGLLMGALAGSRLHGRGGRPCHVITSALPKHCDCSTRVDVMGLCSNPPSCKLTREMDSTNPATNLRRWPGGRTVSGQAA